MGDAESRDVRLLAEATVPEPARTSERPVRGTGVSRALMEARPAAEAVARAAAACGDWPTLSGSVRGCTACPELAASRLHVVVGEAPAAARLLLVGEAPGAQEDETGRPFVGRAGLVLDAALAAAGASRADDVAVANVLKCRPPGNRRPTPAEVSRCRGWLDRQVQLVDPVVVCALGTSAAAWFLGPGGSLAARRGIVHEVGGRSVVVTYHPSGALRFGPAGAPMAALHADVAWAFALSKGAA